MIIKRRKKQPPVLRSPHLSRQKQTTFHYSSNRSQSERGLSRHDPQDPPKKPADAFNNLLRGLKRTPYIIGFATAITGAVYFSLLTASPKVVIRGDQTPVRDGAPYAQLVSSLTGNVQSHSKFTINRQKITRELQSQFPELSQASVKTPLFANHAVIELQLTRPALVLSSGPDLFLLDNRGVALLNIARQTALVKTDALPLVTDQSTTPVETGEQALTTAQVNFITELHRQSQARQLTIESINLSPGAGELAVRYATVPYFVKYNLNEDARKSFGTFIATKEYIERGNVKPAEYIDVRLPERAYVK